MKAPLPPDELMRLDALRSYRILDTEPDPHIDEIALLAAMLCGCPSALVSLIDGSRQWFKSRVGFKLAESSRDIAFCAHTILGRDMLVVPDTLADPRFADNPLVTAEPHIRFYAGAPLLTPDGHAIGTLCVLDRVQRDLSAEQQSGLKTLSRHVVSQFEALRSAALAGRSRNALLSVLEDERLAKHALHENAVFIKDIINSLTANLMVLDGAGVIIEANKPWMDLTDASDAPALTQGRLGSNYLTVCEDLVRQSGDAHARAAIDGIRAVMSGAKQRFTHEYPHRAADGERWYLMSVSPLSGGRSGVVVAQEDISERHRLEEQFLQSQKMEAIGQLAGGVAHDFNNILAVIQMQAGLLQIQLDKPAAVQEHAAEIEKAAGRGANLTRQLLMFSHRQTPQRQDLDLNETVGHIAKMLQRILGEDVDISFKYAPQPLLVHADAGMFDQVLLNLAVNARDAMPGGGRLEIETLPTGAEPDAYACLRVTDTGTGIAPADLPRIFEPFFTTKDVGKGTGLGLATVFGIVQQHQGWIDVASEVGRGTTFRVHLPLLQGQAAPAAETPAPAGETGGTETILLVEDDASLRAAVRLGLVHFGYRIIEAESGASALARWRESGARVDLVITDMVLPGGMNGKELANTLSLERPELKIIYTSGYTADIVDAGFKLEDGVNFLSKPYPIRLLAKAIRAILDAR